MPGGSQMEDWRENPLDPMAPIGIRSRAVEPDTSILRMGPLEKIYLIWMVGGSCDGCTVAVAGATHPRVEHLLAGIIPGLPRVELIHTVVSVEVGPEWTHNLFMAERGELDAPYVICWEGSIMDESIAGEGYWMGLGEDPQTGRQITSLEWLDRLSPGAAAIVAVGTCASWGGIPAAKGNVTNSMGVMDYLGKDYRSAFGVPVVNVPGCSPIGDNVLGDGGRGAACSSTAWPPCPSSTSWAARRGCSARPCTVTVPGPATTRRACSPRSTATRSAWWSWAAGARWCSATSPSGASSTATAAA